MAVSYRIDPLRHLVITTLTDTLSFDECAEHHRRLASDPAFRPNFHELIDGSAVTRVSFGSAAIFSLAMGCPYGPEARRAIYCGNSLTNFGVARMFQTLAHGMHGNIQVFRSVASARAWLDDDAAIAATGIDASSSKTGSG